MKINAIQLRQLLSVKNKEYRVDYISMERKYNKCKLNPTNNKGNSLELIQDNEGNITSIKEIKSESR